jgi:hypothetical protein
VRAFLRHDDVGRIRRADVVAGLEVRNRSRHRQSVERVDLLPRVIPGEASAHAANIATQRRFLYQGAQRLPRSSILGIETLAAESWPESASPVIQLPAWRDEGLMPPRRAEIEPDRCCRLGKTIEIEQRTAGRRFWSPDDLPPDPTWPCLAFEHETFAPSGAWKRSFG